MRKRNLIALLSLTLIILATTTNYSRAENFSYDDEKISNDDQIEMVKTSEYSIDVSNQLTDPVRFEVKVGQKLNLIINNYSTHPITFEVPMMNTLVQIPKNSRAIVPLDFTNPSDDDIWYLISNAGQVRKRPGLFKVTDYPEFVAITMPPSSNIDLSSIINYEKYVETADVEPTYTTPKTKTGGYVRGYW